MAALLGLSVGTAWADPAKTRDALERLEEVLELRVSDGLLSRDDVTPAIVVSVMPRYQDSSEWYAAGALEVLQRTIGSQGLRLCEACMAPRAFVEEGQMAYQTGPVSLDEIARLDERSRGDAAPAKAAIWLDEHAGGVSIRIVDLDTAQVLFAQNIDPDLIENANSERMYTLTEELERRARGDSLTQAFVDFALYPQQHVSLDWTEQWGPTNANLSGVTISLFDPVFGIGGVHYRSTKLFNTLVGGKLILSLPTAAVSAFDDGLGDGQLLDPLVTLAGVVRVPFGRSNYGAVLTVSTNGRVGIGVSLMNISLLPVLP
ncbi:MAG: hypothetical protein AAFV53_29345 [Myxococcota bacterium]